MDSHSKANDIDLLLVYTRFNDKILERKKEIFQILNFLTEYPIDITCLSCKKFENVKFLKRLNKKHIRIK